MRLSGAVGDGPLTTPDGRYIVVRGRLWRRSNPEIAEERRQALVNELMDARRAVRDALKDGAQDGLEAARARVDVAKRDLGERGPVWWTDGAPDENRKLARNSTYAVWFASVADD